MDDMIPTYAAPAIPHLTMAQGQVDFSPIGGPGDEAASTFPVILGGALTLIGYVVGNASTVIDLFKTMVVVGSTEFDYDETSKDESTSEKVRNLLTTDDFNGEYRIGEDTGYLDIPELVYQLANDLQLVLDNFNNAHSDDPPLRGVVSCCVSGIYAVRPIWGKKTATAKGDENTTASQYYLTRLDFGTEAQLATWDGTNYRCDLDGNGSPRETPVVKRVYVSTCPNEPKEEGAD